MTVSMREQSIYTPAEANFYQKILHNHLKQIHIFWELTCEKEYRTGFYFYRA